MINILIKTKTVNTTLQTKTIPNIDECGPLVCSFQFKNGDKADLKGVKIYSIIIYINKKLKTQNSLNLIVTYYQIL